MGHALPRRRSADAPDECWHVHYGDVRIGTIALRTGMPPHEDPWGSWSFILIFRHALFLA
jgi:hypothetical protein